MINQPLLTVIVPCYNMEKYMDKCILSIVNQSYTNLEILLINDGSNDNTGMICDEWQAKDQRIRVFHKQNKGVALARKTGIENAKADYVTFVDSDDWIDVNMYSDMMTALINTNSDIVQCGVYDAFQDGNIKEAFSINEVSNITTFHHIEAVKMFLREKWYQSLCNKIYKKKLFDNIDIQKNRIFGEDQLDYLLFHYASQTVVLNKAYYYYFQRSDSISRDRDQKTEMKKTCDLCDLYFERFFFVLRHSEYHDVSPQVKCMAVCFGMFVLRNLISHPKYADKKYFKDKIEKVSAISLSEEDHLLRSLKPDWNLLKLSPILYKIFISLYFFIIRITNRIKITHRRTFYSTSSIYDSIFKEIKIFF